MDANKLGQCMFFVLLFAAVACGKNNSVVSIPLIEPPVTKATPAGLIASSLLQSSALQGGGHLLSLDLSEVKSRFFSDGPTEIKQLLKDIDGRVSGINTRSSESTRSCLSATPVERSISVLGQTQTVYFQCYDVFSDGTGGMLFGKKDDIWYIYTNVGQQRGLALIAPVVASSGEYVVEAWVSVGQANGSSCSETWYGCSYGVIHLKANSAAKLLEMTVAGTGFGYCGAHLKSEGINLYVNGSSGGLSLDGLAWNCVAADSVCTLAAETSQAGSCSLISDASFELQSLGVDGQSAVGAGITLNGISSDSVHFGPSVTELSGISGVDKF
jgi:hypothetical protein